MLTRIRRARAARTARHARRAAARAEYRRYLAEWNRSQIGPIAALHDRHALALPPVDGPYATEKELVDA